MDAVEAWALSMPLPLGKDRTAKSLGWDQNAGQERVEDEERFESFA